MKRCEWCTKEVSNRFCDQTCKASFNRQAKIDLWLAGEHDGMRGKTSTLAWIKWYVIQLRGEKCWHCGWAERNPHTGTVPVELSHIDGDFTNNRPENLELVCPNCHSLTDSYKGANKKEGRPRSKYYRGL